MCEIHDHFFSFHHYFNYINWIIIVDIYLNLIVIRNVLDYTPFIYTFLRHWSNNISTVCGSKKRQYIVPLRAKVRNGWIMNSGSKTAFQGVASLEVRKTVAMLSDSELGAFEMSRTENLFLQIFRKYNQRWHYSVS